MTSVSLVFEELRKREMPRSMKWLSKAVHDDVLGFVSR